MPTAEQYRNALERLADSTEMAGAGDESQWHGAAAEELRHRIRYAQMALTDDFHQPPPKWVPIGARRGEPPAEAGSIFGQSFVVVGPDEGHDLEALRRLNEERTKRLGETFGEAVREQLRREHDHLRKAKPDSDGRNAE